MAPRHLGQLCLLAITAAWGTTFVVLAEIQRSWMPWPMMTVRFWLGTAVLLPFVTWHRVGLQALRDGAILGFFAFAGFALQTLSMRYTTEAHCAFNTSLITVFVPLLGALVRRQRLQRSTLLAMASALMGMVLLLQGSGPMQAPEGLPPVPQQAVFGDLLAALGALAFAVQILAMESFAKRHPLIPLLVCELGTVALLSQCLMLLCAQHLPPFEAPSYGLIVYLGVVASALCFLGQLWGQARTPATQAAFIFATEPLFAAALAWLLHGQAMAPIELCGGLLVFVSALLPAGPAARLLDRPWRSA